MNKSIKYVSCLFLLLFIYSKNLGAINYAAYNPPPDTSEKAVKKLSNKRAHTAALMSTILPGLGQAYNKKYWKIPFVYAALAGGIALFVYEQSNYSVYHKELLLRYKYNDSASVYVNHNSNPSLANLSTSDLNTQKMVYDKYRDFSVVGILIVYALNIIDASIDGHFKTFDISDDLSLNVKPKTFYNPQSPLGIGGAGFSLSLTFK